MKINLYPIIPTLVSLGACHGQFNRYCTPVSICNTVIKAPASHVMHALTLGTCLGKTSSQTTLNIPKIERGEMFIFWVEHHDISSSKATQSMHEFIIQRELLSANLIWINVQVRYTPYIYVLNYTLSCSSANWLDLNITACCWIGQMLAIRERVKSSRRNYWINYSPNIVETCWDS